MTQLPQDHIRVVASAFLPSHYYKSIQTGGSASLSINVEPLTNSAAEAEPKNDPTSLAGLVAALAAQQTLALARAVRLLAGKLSDQSGRLAALSWLQGRQLLAASRLSQRLRGNAGLMLAARTTHPDTRSQWLAGCGDGLRRPDVGDHIQFRFRPRPLVQIRSRVRPRRSYRCCCSRHSSTGKS